MNPELSAIVQSARDSRPSEFESQLSDVLGQRIVDALDRRRQEMATTIFKDPSVDTEDNEEINSGENQSDEIDTQIEEPNGQDA